MSPNPQFTSLRLSYPYRVDYSTFLWQKTLVLPDLTCMQDGSTRVSKLESL